MMGGIRVISPGFQTTVQDLGRPAYTHLGVSPSGAADPVSLRLGNLLVGNSEGAAALEMTLVGGTFRFEMDALIAVTGSEFGTKLEGRPVSNWSSLPVRAGQVLECGVTQSGARSYLCVRGGIDVPRLLGSASTHLLTGMGGLSGRALREGDVLPVGNCPHTQRAPLKVKRSVVNALNKEVIRITSGPQADLFSDETIELLTSSTFIVTEESNRMGLRLSGPPLKMLEGMDIVTEGVPLGAVQVPRDGQPIILFVEHQTTGGYPKIANVISADMHAIGQLRPRQTVRFSMVTVKQALELLFEQEAMIDPSSLIPV